MIFKIYIQYMQNALFWKKQIFFPNKLISIRDLEFIFSCMSGYILVHSIHMQYMNMDKINMLILNIYKKYNKVQNCKKILYFWHIFSLKLVILYIPVTITYIEIYVKQLLQTIWIVELIIFEIDNKYILKLYIDHDKKSLRSSFYEEQF